MKHGIDRRDFLKLAGVGGAVFASGLYPLAGRAQRLTISFSCSFPTRIGASRGLPILTPR